MLSSLLTSLTSLRDFLSRDFFIAAFVPALLFVSLNGLILYLWSWPAHDWLEAVLFKPDAPHQAAAFVVLFFFIWINAYLISSLTPGWTRTLEGSNWWQWLRDSGIRHHLQRYSFLSGQIEEAVGIYARIERSRPQWSARVQDAIAHPVPGTAVPSATTSQRLNALKAKRQKNLLLALDEITGLVDAQVQEIQASGNTLQLQELAGDIELVMDYAISRARAQHLRAMNDRNAEFGDQDDIAPTRFGNVGLTAQAYAVRAFRCNLVHFWSALRRVADKDETTAKAFGNAKSQLDFLVAGFWLSLVLSAQWAVIFALNGEWKAGLASALAGPLICWFWWYSAAVGQYRLLQELVIASLNAFRLDVLADLRLGVPLDLVEERELWFAADQAIGNGEPLALRYQPRPASAGTPPGHP